MLHARSQAVFHFNGGGKAHHLDMEARTRYKQRRDSPAEEAAVLATELRFNGKMTPFGKICPNHISNTARVKSASRSRH